MSKLAADPAVTTWRIALAPRPRPVAGRHWWRDHVMASYTAAAHAWDLAAEAASNGRAAELATFEAERPRPRLGDFLTHLSAGRADPAREYTCTCGDWHPPTRECPRGGIAVPP